MTNRTCSLIAVLSLGAGFLAALLVLPRPMPTVPAPVPVEPDPASAPLAPGTTPEVNTPTNRLLWASVESADYVRYVANLRSTGCPEQTIRDIVIADICQLYQERWHQCFSSTSRAYWEPEFGRATLASEDEFREAARMWAALKENVAALLGADLDGELSKFRDFAHSPPNPAFLLRGAVRPELVPVVAAAFERHRQCRDLIEQSGPISSEGVLALDRSRKMLRSELAKHLSAGEIQEVEYRCSDAAVEVRELMGGFRLSQAEFQALCRARGDSFEAVANAVHTAGLPLSPDDLLQLSAAHELDDVRLEAALGPERFAAYERSRDLRYQEMERLGQERALPVAWVASLYDQEKQAARVVAEVREDPGLPEAQREVLLREAAEARTARLRGLLGDELAARFGTLLPGAP